MLVYLLFSSVPYISGRINYVDYPPILDDEFEALKAKILQTNG
jgi:hypothetical protein